MYHTHIYGLGYRIRNPFSTFDRNPGSDCAKGMHDAWWYKGLGHGMSVNLMGNIVHRALSALD